MASTSSSKKKAKPAGVQGRVSPRRAAAGVVRRLETPQQPVPDHRGHQAGPRGRSQGLQDLQGHDPISIDQAAARCAGAASPSLVAQAPRVTVYCGSLTSHPAGRCALQIRARRATARDRTAGCQAGLDRRWPWLCRRVLRSHDSEAGGKSGSDARHLHHRPYRLSHRLDLRRNSRVDAPGFLLAHGLTSVRRGGTPRHNRTA